MKVMLKSKIIFTIWPQYAKQKIFWIFISSIQKKYSTVVLRMNKILKFVYKWQFHKSNNHQ
jgi:hypothetical protein